MKKEFPILNYKSSSLIAVPLMAAIGIIYATAVSSMPSDETAKYGLGLIGISGMLSSLCMSYKSHSNQRYDKSIDYAAEKFLLSTILLIQVVFLSYVRDKLISSTLASSVSWSPKVIKGLFGILIIWIYAPACWAWYWAFDEINKVLWSRWKDNIEEVNQKSS